MSTSDLEGFLVRDELEDIIIEHGGFENVAEGGYWGAKLPDTIRIVERDLDEGDPDGYGGWGESAHQQGHEGVCFVVFEYKNRFFRKSGTTDSYARRNWGGKFREVKKGEVAVVKYEWIEG